MNRLAPALTALWLVSAGACSPLELEGVYDRATEEGGAAFVEKQTDLVDVDIRRGPTELSAFRLWVKAQSSGHAAVASAEVYFSTVDDAPISGLPDASAPKAVPLGMVLKSEVPAYIEIPLADRSDILALRDTLDTGDDGQADVHIALVMADGARSEVLDFPFSYCRGCLDYPAVDEACPGGHVVLTPHAEEANQETPQFHCVSADD